MHVIRSENSQPAIKPKNDIFRTDGSYTIFHRLIGETTIPVLWVWTAVQSSDGNTLSGVVTYRWCAKKIRFSTVIAVYLGNGTR